MPRLKVIGYWEEYKCGCVSETVRFKKDLQGYCGKHGADRRHVYRELSEGEMVKLNETKDEAD